MHRARLVSVRAQSIPAVVRLAGFRGAPHHRSVAGYPFDPKRLPSAVHQALFESAAVFAYPTIEAARAALEAEPPPEDVHRLGCKAYLAWEWVALTDFDEDVLAEGPAAIAAIEQALALAPSEPLAARLQSYRKRIVKRMGLAEKQRKKIEKLATQPEDRLHVQEAEELADLLAESRDPERLRKAARLYRTVAEYPWPDTEVTSASSKRLYHLGPLAQTLFELAEYEQALELLEHIVSWPHAEDLRLYPFRFDEAIRSLVEYALDQGQPAQLQRWLALFIRRHREWEPDPNESLLLNREYYERIARHIAQDGLTSMQSLIDNTSVDPKSSAVVRLRHHAVALSAD